MTRRQLAIRRPRSAKHAKRDRRAAVLAAYQQRRDARDAAHDLDEALEAPVRKRLVSRKQRRILYPSGGMKQRAKHAGRRHAKRAARNRLRLDELCTLLDAAVAGRGALVRPMSLRFWGSMVPFIVEGTAGEYEFTFRFRYDRAFLEVGTPGEHGIADVVWAASRDDVTGEPYAGHLSDTEALELVAELFHELAPPAAGSLFTERLSNTLDLLDGTGDPAAPHLMRWTSKPDEPLRVSYRDGDVTTYATPCGSRRLAVQPRRRQDAPLENEPATHGPAETAG